LRAGRAGGVLVVAGVEATLPSVESGPDGGLVFCASASVMLISEFCDVVACCEDLCSGDCKSSICGCPPAIDVSGMPAFRGGGVASVGRSCTRCAAMAAVAWYRRGTTCGRFWR